MECVDVERVMKRDMEDVGTGHLISNKGNKNIKMKGRKHLYAIFPRNYFINLTVQHSKDDVFIILGNGVDVAVQISTQSEPLALSIKHV
jgi:hypothetical protein